LDRRESATTFIIPSSSWSVQHGKEARLRLAGVVALTLATTGVSVVFNFLGRDFFNALSAKDVDGFYHQLQLYLAGFAIGIPVFVFKDYYQARLALNWRKWMTENLMDRYLDDRAFYRCAGRNCPSLSHAVKEIHARVYIYACVCVCMSPCVGML